jgi:gamma-glutamylcyclotransferase (GGCT)/AIG2-like uncharacterized protein YtfP
VSEDDRAMIRVAVYGTLKKGYENYQRLLDTERPIFGGFVRVPFRMFDNGEYPLLLPSKEPRSIYVEVFEVDSPKLKQLDDLEEPYNYRRETLYLDELGHHVEVYVFAGGSPPAGFSELESGNWRPSTGD